MFLGFFSVLSTYLAPLYKTDRRLSLRLTERDSKNLSQRITNYENQRLIRGGKAT